LGVGVSAMSILGLTGAIMNIFTTTFSISSSMSAAIVSKFLSRGQTKEALMEAKRLKGFMFLTSTSLSILMFITAIFVPKFLFLSQVKYEEEKLTFDNIQNLKQVRDSLFIVCFYYPI
jgi:Na+-driven multidrug efflux pump